MSRSEAIQLIDLLAIIAFVVGLKRLSHPATARSGNTLAAGGMLAAIAATLADEGVVSYWAIAVAIAIGSAIGVLSARSVKMTAMPQMVALFNGVGGGGAGLIALAEYHRLAPEPGRAPLAETIAIALSLVIGCLSFAGSVIAFAKLQELIGGRPVTYPAQKPINALVAAAVVILAASISFSDGQTRLIAAGALALLLGVLFVLPIGGADMPVVISLLNSCTGIAAAASGFVLHNDLLIVSGTLVGASGTLLTRMMGQAMNRPLTNVLFGAFGGGGGSASAGAGTNAAGGTTRSLGASDAAVLLSYASRVVIVPGYGLAVAQAQHVARELSDLLEAKRIDVRFAIHPVAGRMPGHMNVLLAEADVPYTQLYEMERINPEFARTDVVLVIGANDVTNPAARTSPESPIFGMPILEVDRAKQVIVLKRSLGTGFAGVDNALYYEPNCSMLFGDAKASLNALVAAVSAL
ncbi:MAG TPA: NAD(P)(+) transhydrogenase (Re/Si-specific) subunit beta [Gaiellales bacterium]|jgi:NAD(P) transhydrogenase subunit beta